MIYTSGSTGRAEGVPILHRGVHGLLFGNDYYAAGPGDRFLQTAPIAFDASVFDIWGALANGAELVFYRERIPTAATLGAAIADHRITTLWLTPSVFNGIAAEDPRIFAGVRQLVLGGEPLSPHHVRLLYDAVADITVINGYGPTENSDFTCCYRVPRAISQRTLRIPSATRSAATSSSSSMTTVGPLPMAGPACCISPARASPPAITTAWS
ncbi:MAG: AMP-binding protein [Alphaproteobacteria bacterium]|nr:AMP-binding protein [Alphaproteobacteria bacterium]